MKANRKKSYLTVKIATDEKELIGRAAKASGHTVSSFVRFASISLAKKIQLDDNPETDRSELPKRVIRESVKGE